MNIYPYSNCCLCNTQGKLLYQGLTDRLCGTPGKWNLIKCTNPECGLVWIDPMPTEDDISKAYINYFTHESRNETARAKDTRKFIWLNAWRIYRALLFLTWVKPLRRQRNTMYLNEVKPGRLLDVGCGDGHFLARMRDKGWDVEGHEIDQIAAQRALRTYGFNVSVGRLEDIGYPEDSFDAVVLSHVIEHVNDPIRILQECRQILKPGGILVVVTPNVESFGHWYFESCFRDLDPPRHLYLFTKKTLQCICKKAGFSRYKVWTTALDIVYHVGIGSLDIRRDGWHRIESTPKIVTAIGAMFFHLLARIICVWDSNSGEECVLKAVK